MNPGLAQTISALCNAAINQRVFPGCVVGVVRGGEHMVLPFGGLTYQSDAEPVTAGAIYDVASVTKSIPTSTLALMLLEQGRLHLDDPVITYIPELQNQYREHILIRHLLTFTVLFDMPDGFTGLARQHPKAVLEHLFKTPLLAPPGEKYFYTNPPSVLMGLVIERVLSQPLNEAAEQLVFRPLGMSHSTFFPQSGHPVAPTEITDWRGEVRGVPHDETAYTLQQAGQTAGNAGLFTTADDLMAFCQMVLNGGVLNGQRLLKETTVAEMAANQLAGIGAQAGLGWEINRTDVMGSAGLEGVVMKSGFTGCLVVIDRPNQRAMVHLSNRTYPKRPEREPIRAFWRSLNEVIFR